MVIDKVINKLSETYPLEEMDIGEYALIKKNGMKFNVHSYEVGNVGCVSTLKMSAMLGLMKMETVVFSPLGVDAPLFSFDYIKAMGNETLLIEIYDLTVNKGKKYPNLIELKECYSALPDHELKPCWYDDLRVEGTISKRSKKCTAEFNRAVDRYLDEFMNILQNAEAVDEPSKRAVIKEYVDGLFDKGSPTTAQFNKILGEEKARDMYGKYIFFSVKAK